jgi:hypothetical protein
MLICNRLFFWRYQVEYRFEEMSFIYFKIDSLTKIVKIHKPKKMLIFCGLWNIFREFIRKTWFESSIMRCENYLCQVKIDFSSMITWVSRSEIIWGNASVFNYQWNHPKRCTGSDFIWKPQNISRNWRFLQVSQIGIGFNFQFRVWC